MYLFIYIIYFLIYDIYCGIFHDFLLYIYYDREIVYIFYKIFNTFFINNLVSTVRHK